jgi:hypothetical protein
MRHPKLTCTAFVLILCGSWSIANAQTPATAARVETPIVLRISKQLVEELTADDFVVDLPVSDQFGNLPIDGTIKTRSKVNITLLTSNKSATCLLSARGQAHAMLTASKGPITVQGQAWIPYHVETQVTFDGTKFKAHPITSRVRVCTQIDGIYTRRNGPLGRMFRRIAAQTIDEAKPRLDAHLYQQARHKFEVELAAVAADLVAQLNSTNKLDRMIANHFPESSNWNYHVSSTDKIIFAAVGPKNAVIPNFRTLANGAMQAPMDLWIRTTWEETAVINAALVWKSTHELLKHALPAKVADALADDITLATEGNWFVVTVGRGAFPRLPAKKTVVAKR